ncbi:MAG: energy transducer TonB [Flavobacterium sp. JAD_PAG50586_2]|nr:MAG: energy transducer TonB [Flavobacterium sp. JAD_PAG50586_2]
MKKITLLALLFCSQLIVAQIYKENEVDTKPSFPGGQKSFKAFVAKNFKWADNKRAFVTLELTVQTNGVIFVTNMTGLVDPRYGKEALRVMGLSPKWKPATLKGKKVVCKVTRSMYNPHYNEKEEIVKAAPIQEPVDIAPVNVPESDNSIYSYASVEQKPDYPGGIKQFYTLFNSNFKQPEQENLKAKVMASFVIEKDGSLSDIKVIKDIGYGTSEEITRVLKMGRKWIPGKQNFKIVRVSYTLPILIDTTTKPSPENK